MNNAKLYNDKKYYFQLPDDLSDYGMQAYMFDFKSRQIMDKVKYTARSSLIFDWRLDHQIEDSKHNN